MLKKLTVLFAFAIFVLVVGMQTDGYACHKGGNDPKGCGGTPSDDGGGGPIPVTVTFWDFLGDDNFSPDRLMSDCHEEQGDCPYIDKVDKVVTLIRSTVGGKGNFAMHTSKFAIRQLFLDFRDCASEDTEECIPPSHFLNSDRKGFTPGPTNLYTSGVDLGEMGVGEDKFRDDLRLSVGIDLNSVEGGIYTLFFYPYFAGCLGSSPVSVTRQPLSTDPADTWEIEAGPDAVACLAENVGAADYAFRGLYHMPFQMIMQKK